MGQRDRTMGKVLALYMADLGLIPSNPYGYLSTRSGISPRSIEYGLQNKYTQKKNKEKITFPDFKLSYKASN